MEEFFHKSPAVHHAKVFAPGAELFPEFGGFEGDAGGEDKAVSASDFVGGDTGEVFVVGYFNLF